MNVDRRTFVKGALGVSGAVILGRSFEQPAAAATTVGSAPASTLPNPLDSGIDHVILVMMENRSFDHFLGWLPGSDGRQAGLSYFDPSG
jgi:phospholipase C